MIAYFDDFDEFRLKMKALEARILNYFHMWKSNYQKLPNTTLKQLEWRRAKYLHANNFSSRIAFAEIMLRHVTEYVEGADRALNLNFITLTPDIFAVPEAEASAFDLGAMKIWLSETLKGYDFIGNIEVALYPRWPHGHPTVSYHFHGVQIGQSKAQLDQELAVTMKSCRSLVEGIEPFHVEPLGRSKLQKKLLYIWKFPMRAYNPQPEKVSVRESNGEVHRVPTGPWKQSKPPLQTGQLVTMCRVLQDHFLDQMILGGGTGEQVAENIRREALRQYNAEEERRSYTLPRTSQRKGPKQHH